MKSGKYLANIITYYQNYVGDREFYFRYLRMNPERFDHLLSFVNNKITKENTRVRKSISAEERVLLTLGFRATGMSQ